ncbi:CPBP family intramembrane metalloprotease [Mariniluteicoccus endophyticus]
MTTAPIVAHEAITDATPRLPRLAALTLALSFVGIVAATVPFLDPATAYPEWLTAAGRWIPGLASLVALLVLRPRSLRDLPTLWGLRTGGWRTVLAGMLTAVASLLAVTFAVVLLGTWLGWVEMKPLPLVGAALLALPLYLVVGSISTLGEEVVWRGLLPRTLGSGIWPTAALVAVLWMLWHVPQLGMFVARGEMPVREMVASLVGIAFWSLPLSALAHRFGSVWPAVVGHALPFRPGSLAAALPADTVAFWAFCAVECAANLGLALFIARR